MKVIKQPTKAITTEETCKDCGAVLELYPWDYKEETLTHGNIFDYYYTVKRKWYVCPCCHAVNVVKTLID